MVFLNQEYSSILKKFGYKVRAKDNIISIRNSSTPSYFVSAIGMLAGILLIVIPFGEYKITLLGLLLIMVAFINFRKNLSKSILFDPGNNIISYTSGFFGRRILKSFNDVNGIALYTYDRSSYTSAFEEGNRDYFVDICIQWKEKDETELFHFKTRSQRELEFTKPLIEQLNNFINPVKSQK